MTLPQSRIDDKTQECRACGHYWFNGVCRTGTKCPDCSSMDTFFTGENGLAMDLTDRQRSVVPRAKESE